MKKSQWIPSCVFSLALSLTAFGCGVEPESPSVSQASQTIVGPDDPSLPVPGETTCHCVVTCADTGHVFVGVSRNHPVPACISASNKCANSGCTSCEPHDDESYCE
jgi:hypothetical protein